MNRVLSSIPFPIVGIVLTVSMLAIAWLPANMLLNDDPGVAFEKLPLYFLAVAAGMQFLGPLLIEALVRYSSPPNKRGMTVRTSGFDKPSSRPSLGRSS